MVQKKCVFLLTSLDAGGAETYLLRYLTFANGLIEAVVITKEGRTGALLTEYEKYSSKIMTVQSGYLNFNGWIKLYGILKKENPDVVCDFTGNFAGIPLFLSKLLHVKKRIAFYRRSTNAFTESKVNLLYNAVMNFLVLKSATHILANSNAGLNFFFKSASIDSRMRVIRNGIDVTSFKPSASREELRNKFGIKHDAFIIGHTGRLNKAKNHQTLLEVATQLKQSGINFQLVLCGKDTEKLIQDLPKSLTNKDVISLGYQTAIADVLTTFDFYLFPSITEGMPNALMEAMMLGIPFAASNIAAISEIVPKEYHQFLFEPTDVSSFVKCIEKQIQLGSNFSSSEIQNFAKDSFNSNKNFRLFYETLDL